MTSSAIRTAGPPSAPRLDLRRYLAASAPFFLVFAGSVVLTFADLEATRLATLGSGFPGWVVVPQGVAKALGLLAILSRWSPLLTGLAFAGFLYDTLLALGAHLVQQDLPNSALATTGLLATLAAYRAHRRRYPAG